MNWEAIGAIGEILGAGVVSITLVFLILQIRQNTNSVRTQTIFNVIHEANAINSVLGSNREAARIFEVGQNQPEELTSEEQVQSQALIRTIVNLANAGFLARDYDAIPERLWQGLRASAGHVAMTKGGRRFMQANVSYWGADFAEEIAPQDQRAVFDRIGWQSVSDESDTR